LTIIGGGGFRVPLVYGALRPGAAAGTAGGGRADGAFIDEVALYDLDPPRLAVMGRVLAGLPGPPVVLTADLDAALAGASFVFCAVRVGGLAGRVADERVALDLGLLGQETVGPGGVAYGLRTVPVLARIAERVATVAPEAWTIDFTNPVGMVTEAMSRLLGDRVIGICDSPVGLFRRVAWLLGVPVERVWFDYAGLNHLGWLTAARVAGRDRLPGLLAEPAALGRIEEGRLFGPDWLRALGAIPNEYLFYYYATREAIAAVRDRGSSRGEFLARQQEAFYAAVSGAGSGAPDAGDDPGWAAAEWGRVRAERDATYLPEARRDAPGPGELSGGGKQSNVGKASGGERPGCEASGGEPSAGRERSREGRQFAGSEPSGGGYEQVALAAMQALAGGPPATLVLNVRNRGALAGLDRAAVVEVPCLVDGNGAHPLVTAPLPDHARGLVTAVKAVERATIAAALTGSRDAALRAFALHPLVDSVEVAHRLLAAYAVAHPELAHLAGR
jgi:6-phospho-beta-glucosidase